MGSSVWTELVRSRRSTCAIPSPNAKAKQSYEPRMDHISGFYAAHEPAAQPFKREPSWAKRGPSFSRQSDSSSPDRRETYFLVRAIERGLEASRPQELSSRMRSDTRQTRAAVFHKQAQALAFPFLSLKEEVYKVLLKA